MTHAVFDRESKNNLQAVRSAAAMAFGSSAGCFAGAISIISATVISCWLKVAFALFVAAIPLLMTAGLLFEFIASRDLNREGAEPFALYFAKPGYVLAAIGLIALSGHFYWAFAAISVVLILLGYAGVRRALRKHSL
jgi:hypothetical protein